MKKFAALALLAGGVALSAHAKEDVGYLSIVQGNISIGGQGFAAKAEHGARLVDGNTVMVPTKGRASVIMNNGCTVDLAGSQYFKVDSKLPCAQLQASVSQMFNTHRVAQAPVGGGISGGGAGGPGAAGMIGTLTIVSAVAFAAVKGDEKDASGN